MKYVSILIALALVGGIIATPTMLKNISQYLDAQTLLDKTTKATALNNVRNMENTKTTITITEHIPCRNKSIIHRQEHNEIRKCHDHEHEEKVIEGIIQKVNIENSTLTVNNTVIVVRGIWLYDNGTITHIELLKELKPGEKVAVKCISSCRWGWIAEEITYKNATYQKITHHQGEEREHQCNCCEGCPECVKNAEGHQHRHHGEVHGKHHEKIKEEQ